LRFGAEEIHTTRLLMRSRLLHALLTLTTLLVVWLVTSPALAREASGADASFSASFLARSDLAPVPATSLAPIAPIAPTLPTDRAPLCDPRGAITFASAPQMQDPEASIDTGLTLDDCFSASRDGDVNRAAPGRAPLPNDAQSASSDAVVLATRVMLAACARELLPAPVASTSCSRPGIRSTVDRPPRA
jgi:hypothetical protein